LKALYELPGVKRLLTKRKLSKVSLRKASTTRLRKWYSQFYAMVTPPDMSKLFENPLKPLRVQAGLTIGEVAAECDVPYKVIYNAEAADTPNPALVDQVIGAIATLKGTKVAGCNHVSYPTGAKARGAAVGGSVPVESTDREEDFDGGDTEEHGYVDPYGYDVEEDEDQD